MSKRQKFSEEFRAIAVAEVVEKNRPYDEAGCLVVEFQPGGWRVFREFSALGLTESEMGRTVVAIAHRLHTAYAADRVAALEDGRLVKIGSHADLLSRNGVYASLWRAWQEQQLVKE